MTKPLFFDTDCLSPSLWVNNQSLLSQLYPGRILKQDGWIVDRKSGSHYILKKNGKHISLPLHTTEMPTGLCEKLLKQAGLK